MNTDSGQCVEPENILLDVLYKDKNTTYTYTNNATAQPGDGLSKKQELCSFCGSPAWLWKLPIIFEGIIHCIDKETSGILILAKKLDSA